MITLTVDKTVELNVSFPVAPCRCKELDEALSQYCCATCQLKEDLERAKQHLAALETTYSSRLEIDQKIIEDDRLESVARNLRFAERDKWIDHELQKFGYKDQDDLIERSTEQEAQDWNRFEDDLYIKFSDDLRPMSDFELIRDNAGRFSWQEKTPINT